MIYGNIFQDILGCLDFFGKIQLSHKGILAVSFGKFSFAPISESLLCELFNVAA